MGTGHSDLFSENGQDWLVHHAKRPDEDYRAYLHIRQMRWLPDDLANAMC